MANKAEIIGRNVRLVQPVEQVTMSLDDYLKGRYKKERSELSSRSTMLIGRIEKYIEDMKPPKMVSAAGAGKNQAFFLQTVLGILESDSQDAMLMWDVLLFLANKYSVELFNERMACRFYNMMPEHQQQPFLKVMNLVVATANVRRRAAALRLMPLQAITAILSNEKQKANLAAYYASNV